MIDSVFYFLLYSNSLMILSILFSTLHIWEEIVGEGGPLWHNFGTIVGTRIPDGIGFFFFSGFLWISLVSLAISGYLYDSKSAISLLLGARLGDTLLSHWGLRALNLSNPNPGIWTTALYVLEAIWILRFFQLEMLPVFVGMGAFVFVLPTIWLWGRLFGD